MQIKRILVENFRAIDHRAIDLTDNGLPRRRLVLMGPNGCGKTTLLRAIAHLFGTFDDQYGAPRLGPIDVRRAPSPSDSALPSPAVLPSSLEARVEIDAQLAAEELLSIRGEIEAPPATGALRLRIGSGGDAGAALMSLLDATVPVYEDAFQHAARAAVRAASPAAAPCVLLPADRGTLTVPKQIQMDAVAQYTRTRACLAPGTDRYSALAAHLALAHAAPSVYDREGGVRRMWAAVNRYMNEMPRPLGVDGLTLVLRNRHGVPVYLAELSDGERAVLLILAEVALRNPRHGVVLIDEIEQHLHPLWQEELLAALQALAPTTQFIVTTQADYIVRSAPRDTIKLGEWGRDAR